MSGKSKEEVAFELVAKLKGVGVWGENNRTEILDMYAECLEATSGLRRSKQANAAAHVAPAQFVPNQAPTQQAAPLQAVQQAPQTMPQAAPQQVAQAYNPAAQQR